MMHPEELSTCIPVFGLLPEKEIARIARGVKERTVAEGVLLFKEGDIATKFFILAKGEVEIIKALGSSDERQLAIRKPCCLLGELSLFSDDGTHTASVKALSNLQLFEMGRDELESLLHNEPEFTYELIRTLSKRLVEGEDRTIQDLRRKNRELSQALTKLKEAQAELVEKKRYERELEVAREIQMSMLPVRSSIRDQYSFATRIEPMKAVGGDFFDFLDLGDKKYGIAIGDVSDHGVPASLFMALTATLLRVEAGSLLIPSEILRSVNRHLLKINETNMSVTLLFGILDAELETFNFARAGHEYPVALSPNGGNIPIDKHRGQPLGWFEDMEIHEGILELPKGSLMALYTDGVVDAMNPEGNTYGLTRLTGQLIMAQSNNAEGVADLVWSSLDSFQSGVEQVDDLTLCILKAE